MAKSLVLPDLVSRPVLPRAHAGDLPELPVEVGHIVETAVKTDLRNIPFARIGKELAGIPDPDLLQESGKGLFRPFLEIDAEGAFRKTGFPGNIHQADHPCKMPENIFIDPVDPLHFELVLVPVEISRGNGLGFGDCGQVPQDLQDLDHGFISVHLPQLLEILLEGPGVNALEVYPVAGPLQQRLERNEFGDLEKPGVEQVLLEMDGDGSIPVHRAGSLPAVGQIGPHQHQVAGSKKRDVPSHEPSPASIHHIIQFIVLVGMDDIGVLFLVKPVDLEGVRVGYDDPVPEVLHGGHIAAKGKKNVQVTQGFIILSH